MSLLGIHVHSIEEVLSKCNKEIKFFQIFVDPLKDYTTFDISSVIEYIKSNRITIAVHSSYTINIAKKWHEFDWWVEYIIEEIQICSKIGAYGIVLHTGNKLNLSESEAINNMYTLLLHIHRKTNTSNIKILIETPAGQGTEMLADIEEYCRFMSKFFDNTNVAIQNRFGCCIDSCHIFVAGYDITDKKELSNFFTKIRNTIGLDKIKLCHLNDAKGNFGSMLDRHANFGDGNIGKKYILDFVKIINHMEIPIIIETPIEKIYDDFKFVTASLCKC